MDLKKYKSGFHKFFEEILKISITVINYCKDKRIDFPKISKNSKSKII